MATIKNPTEMYMRNTGYSARAFLPGTTAVLMKGKAAHELQASVRVTTTAFTMTLSFTMHIRAPISKGNKQYPRRLMLWKKIMCPPRSRTFSVRIIAPAARTAKATANTCDWHASRGRPVLVVQRTTK